MDILIGILGEIFAICLAVAVFSLIFILNFRGKKHNNCEGCGFIIKENSDCPYCEGAETLRMQDELKENEQKEEENEDG